MFNYLLRRLLYVIPIVLGVILLTFIPFFVLQKPETMARVRLGKVASPEAVKADLAARGYDKPTFFNLRPGEGLFDSIFFHETGKLLRGDLGRSDVTKRELKEVFREGVVPSLLITLPAFVVGLCLATAFSLYLVLLRDSPVDRASAIACVALMSLPAMVYIIFGQGVIALAFNYFPVFGYEAGRLSTVRFLLLPVALMVVIGLGSDIRLYRAIFLEEAGQDYVRTALAKGVPTGRVYGVHILKNGLIALITLTVAHLPLLILGSLLMENFFGIPGLGNTLYLAISTQDFATVRAFVFLSALLIQLGLIATDICYALVDPRIRFS